MTKIAKIEPIPLRIPYDHWAPPPMHAGKPRTAIETLLVRVTTDNGLVGWGEAYGPMWQAIVPTFENWIAPLAAGQEVEDVGLTARMERTLHNFGRAGPSLHAISGLDIALWDLRGKLAGASVSTLLGGRKRDQIAVYASLLHYNGVLDNLKRAVARALDAGYRQLKLHERTTAAVTAARELMGADLPLMVDTNCAWSREEAIATVDAMASSGLQWIEEPIWPPEDFASLAAVRRSTGVATAAGENATGALDFTKMIAAEAVDYVQPSAVKIGGVTALWRICVEAEQAGAVCAPHSPYFGPGYLATLHVLAAKQKPSAIEKFFCDLGMVPFERTVRVVDGHIRVPDGPGLGADPEPELIEKFHV
jgi:L-alanine-DL-glutamate epimerase-like enolase superfamily enzyme